MHLFILKHDDLNTCIGEDLSDIVFDYDTENDEMCISSETPEPIFSKFSELWEKFLASYKIDETL